MKYIGIIEKENTITVDGYSKAKTLKGALNDLGRFVENNIDESEGRLLQVANKEEAEELIQIGNHSYSEYGIEVEEVGCATKVDEEGNIVEYSEANFYVMLRFVK